MKKLWHWLMPLLISLDQTLNVLLRKPLNWAFNSTLFGDPDETMSSVFGKEVLAGNRRAYWVCRALHWLDKDHCAKSIEKDEGRAG